MSYRSDGQLLRGNSVQESKMKTRRKTTRTPLAVVPSKDPQRPGASSGHRRAQRQRNKVAPMERDAGTSTAAAAARCLFCLPGTRAVSVYPVSSRKGSVVVERSRSAMNSGGKAARHHPQIPPRYTPNEVVLNWKAFSQSSSPPSTAYRSRTEASQAYLSPWQPVLTQNPTTYNVPSTPSL